jgi:sucrose-phosphate synthase
MRIVFLNPQGNFDRTDAFWTEHPDFGGQLVYVKEIALSLSKLGHEVDIVTRKFQDKRFNLFNKNIDYYDQVNHTRIVRIPCGPDEFLNKERLWEHLHEWVDNIVDFYKNENTSIDFITTHYGDGGISGLMLSKKLNIPFSFTGHSLGAQKMDKLNLNSSNMEVLVNQYKFGKRLLAERTSIKYADCIFVSTKQERDEQYSHPSYSDVSIHNKDQRFFIAPPGANLDIFSYDKPNQQEEKFHKQLNKYLMRDIAKDRQDLPFIVSASRLDPKKNHIALLKTYSLSKKLQDKANIAISLRGVENAYKDYHSMNQIEISIMDDLMKIIIDHQLEGKVTFVNITSQAYLASAYRFFANKASIFTLTALYEPFGLAPIEAMAAGLPAAVTKYGGPSEVLKDSSQEYGVLLDVKDSKDMESGYLRIFDNYKFYKDQGLKRVYETYNWLSTAKVYEKAIHQIKNKYQKQEINIPDFFINPNHTINEIEIIKSYYLGKGE